MALTFGEPVWEDNPPEWATRLFDAMARADRASQGRCMDCGGHALNTPCPVADDRVLAEGGTVLRTGWETDGAGEH